MSNAAAAREWQARFQIIVVCRVCDRQFAPQFVEVDTQHVALVDRVTVGFVSNPECPVCSITNAPGGDT